MASGGLALRGKPILVGDAPGGRLTPYSEIIVPNVNSTVFNASETRQIMNFQPSAPQNAPMSPQALATQSITSAVTSSVITNKNYTFAPTIQAPANDLIRSFRLMETFAL
jgi:hypothetical protein